MHVSISYLSILVFRIIFSRNIRCLLCFKLFFRSLVMGLAEEKPSSISFQQNFDAGACLTIGWSSGRIQYYPIIYTDLTNSMNGNRTANISLYRSFNTSHI